MEGTGIYEPLTPVKPDNGARSGRYSRWCYVAGFLLVVGLAAGGGVGLAMAVRKSPPTVGVEQYLTKVDEFLDSRPRQSFIPNDGALMQVFGPGSYGGGSCGKLCKLQEPCPFNKVRGLCRFDVYDNALAAIYYTARQNFAQAKSILDGFLYYMYVKRQETNDKVTCGPEQGLPSGRMLNLLAASYTSARVIPGQYEGLGVADGAVDAGNNAWVGIAMMRYAAATGDPCYATAGCDMLFALNHFSSCEGHPLGGFRARLAPYPMNYRSTEHNIDMFVLASMCRNTTLAASAASFVAGMFDKDSRFPGAYATGTTNEGTCGDEPATSAIPTDCQTWNFLSGADPDLSRKAASLGYVVKPSSEGGLWETDADLIGAPDTEAGKGESYVGTRFSSYGSGIQWENSAAAVLALLKLLSAPEDALRQVMSDEQLANMRKAANEGRESLKKLINTYGAVPASILGGNYDMWASRYDASTHSVTHPGGSDAGLGWTYLRYPHVASTVWAALALMYQFDEGGPTKDMANPYGASEGFIDVLYNGDTTCIGPPPAPDLANCKLFPRCVAANLTGDCCPAPGGLNLGCCDTKSSCSRHPRCAAANLTGDCCPAPNGKNLGCCE